MAWVIAVLGALLALGGGVALWTGSGYIRLDWGQAETVAGTVALTGGIITLALAAVLFTLRDLARRPVRAASSGVGLEALHLDEADTPPPPPAPARNRFTNRLATMGLPKAEPAAPEAPATARDLDEPFSDSRSLQEPAPGAPVLSAPEPAFDPRPRSGPEAPQAPEPVVVDAPTVVGRYEANGASYVLFSDGTIEVETDSGTHRFASMAALKEHIERQDAG